MVRPLTTLARFSVFTRLPSRFTLARVAASSAAARSSGMRAWMAAHSSFVTTLRAGQSRNCSTVQPEAFRNSSN